jgi:hypothetical protein
LNGSSASISTSIVNTNRAQGGAGATGGNGLGGGLYNDAGAALALAESNVNGNSADGGAGGTNGLGIGGGLFNLGTFTEVFTVIRAPG